VERTGEKVSTLLLLLLLMLVLESRSSQNKSRIRSNSIGWWIKRQEKRIASSNLRSRR